MVTVLKEKGIFAGVNLFSKQDTMDITDMFKIPLFKNFTLKMREEFLDKLEYTVEEHPKGKTIIHQGTTCNALHVLLKGKLNVDVLDVSGNIVRVETIQAPRKLGLRLPICRIGNINKSCFTFYRKLN